MRNLQRMLLVLAVAGTTVSCETTSGSSRPEDTFEGYTMPGPGVPFRVGQTIYMSMVGWTSPNQKDGMLQGQVGHHFTASISWDKIGVYRIPHEDGAMPLLKRAIDDPEFRLFGELPPGLRFDEVRGNISGTPQSPGKWQVYPAVRCKIRGDNVYKGSANWSTERTTSGGKVWTKAKDATTIDISK